MPDRHKNSSAIPAHGRQRSGIPTASRSARSTDTGKVQVQLKDPTSMKKMGGNRGRLAKSAQGIKSSNACAHMYTIVFTHKYTYIYLSMNIPHIYVKKAQLSNLDAEREVARHRNEMQRASW